MSTEVRCAHGNIIVECPESVCRDILASIYRPFADLLDEALRDIADHPNALTYNPETGEWDVDPKERKPA